MSEYHGHDVIKLIMAQEEELPLNTLLKLIYKTFGEDATYYTCSQQGLSAVELLDYLNQKGKFLNGSLIVDETKICQSLLS